MAFLNKFYFSSVPKRNSLCAGVKPRYRTLIFRVRPQGSYRIRFHRVQGIPKKKLKNGPLVLLSCVYTKTLVQPDVLVQLYMSKQRTDKSRQVCLHCYTLVPLVLPRCIYNKTLAQPDVLA